MAPANGPTSASTSAIDFLIARFAEALDKPAMILEGRVTTYAELRDGISETRARLLASGVGPGSVVALLGDYSRDTVTGFLALWDMGAIVLPIAPASIEKSQEFIALGEAEFVYDTLRTPELTATGVQASHAHYAALRQAQTPGLVLFSSGTTGVSKGVVHDAGKLLQKFRTRRKDLTTLAFLLFDHIGGIDTLLYCLSNVSTLVFTHERDPHAVCALMETHRVEVLPTAPSFLNFLLMAEAQKGRDLSALKIITYGAEMMPQATLERCADAFPGVQLLQKYGTSEIGTLRSASRDNRSRWVRIGGEDCDWRVRDGFLEIRTGSAMLGYLNAPHPFTEDGYFMTGDLVEVDGDFVRFLGRTSQVINVAGQKVFPAEVEDAIRDVGDVLEVSVFGEPNPMLGHIVCARIRPRDPAVPLPALRKAIRAGLAGRLESYKIPRRFELTQESLTTDRFKQIR